MEYEVLYYKRTNKVHKSKGVSKLDGILRIQPENGSILLQSAQEEDTVANTAMSNRKNVVYSGRNTVIATEALEEDQIVTLGGFEVQILTVMNQSCTNKRPPQQQALLNGTKPIIKKTLLPQKRKVNPLQSHSKNKSSSIVQRNTVTQKSSLPLPRKPCPPIQPTRQPGIQAGIRKRAVPPKQPQQQQQVQNNNSVASSSSALILPHIPLTASIRSALRPHQVEGVDFLWRCLTGNLRGALCADEMGLGKTLMTIAVIASLHKQNRSAGFVVVCPSSLVSNWAQEFDKWLGKAGQPKRVAIKKGGEEGQQEMRSYCSKMKQSLSNQVGQVLIVSYDLFRLNANIFQGIKAESIGLLVCDEAHRLKNTAGSLTLSALEKLDSKRLCLSATPIQNNLSEFYTLANFVCPGLLGPLTVFRRDFERPISAGNSKSASREQKDYATAQSANLDRITQTFMLRRLQKDVLTKLLPPRTEALLFCAPSLQQSELYKKSAKPSIKNDATDVLSALTKLRKICTHPQLAETSDEGGKAPVATATDISLSGKLHVLGSLLQAIREKAPTEKVVVVSNFTSALSIVEASILKPHNLTYVRLDGTTDVKNRQNFVNTFNMTSPETLFCFLLSAKAGGCGLNLVGASRLIVLDPDWNPAVDIQVMGRVYRQGQTKPTVIYRMFTSGSIEEVILQRQMQKGNLSKAAVDGDRRLASSFSKEEVQDCLTLKAGPCDTKVKIGQKWPSYSGSQSIQSSGCDDEALLMIADQRTKVLSHVHIVDSNEMEPIIDSDVDDASKAQFSRDAEEASSDSENEFEG